MDIRNNISELAVAASQFVNEREYWVNLLSGNIVKSVIPYDYPLGSEQERRMAQVSLQFSPEVDAELSRLSNNSEIRRFMILLAGAMALYHKYTEHEEIVLGTPIVKQEVEAAYINTMLPIKGQLGRGISFRDLLLKIKDTFVQASEHQNYPFSQLLVNLGYEQGDVLALFESVILLDTVHEWRYIEHFPANLVMYFTRRNGISECQLHYNSALYAQRKMEGMLARYQQLLHAMLTEINRPIDEIELVTAAEREALVVDFNRTEVEFPGQYMIHQLFEMQVQKTPEHPAVIMGDQQWSYREVNQRANQLARKLRAQGVVADSLVGILTLSSVETVVAILATLKAGGAYLPVAPDYPEQRKSFMLTDSGVGVLLTQRPLLRENSFLSEIIPEERIIFLDDKAIYTGKADDLQAAELQADEHKIAELQADHLGTTGHKAGDLKSASGPDNLAYVIYTSGTTGKPKGVMLEHRGVVNYLVWAAKTYVRGDKVNFPLFTSISFDLTVTSIFTPLITGNAIVIYGEEEGKELLIAKIVEDGQVGVIKLTPSHLKILRDTKKTHPAVKRFIVGGEDLEVSLAREIGQQFPGVEIFNEYGPTETVVGCMIHRFDPAEDDRKSVPIGVPIDNAQIYVLNRELRPVPVDFVGEIYISGVGVARGYLNRPELTAERFVENPFIPGSRMYKTGDLARHLHNGKLEFLGRVDQQVKIRGYRIELGEIEQKIRAYQPTSFLEKVVAEEEPQRCTRCLLSSRYPAITFDEEGVCNYCRDYESYEAKVQQYFKSMDDFYRLVERVKPGNTGDYDCLLLYSGGKDSSYVLYRLVDMGLKVLTFTFDNDYISEAAFKNIKRTTAELQVDHLTIKADNMREIFLESLTDHYNVCSGCWKALNALSAKLAYEKGIKLVITGLSRGQILEMKLQELFEAGIFAEEEIEEKLLLSRKMYHSTKDSVHVQLSDEVLEQIQFVDFFRYDDQPVEAIMTYLAAKGWSKPEDTGFCSTNCLINDVGIHVHEAKTGFHFYEAPLSWDCRLGVIDRAKGLRELEFTGDEALIAQILDELGYEDAEDTAWIRDCVVLEQESSEGVKSLAAYIASPHRLTVAELRKYLSGELPEYMIPEAFFQINQLPLTANGKVDRKALLALGTELASGATYEAPVTDLHRELVSMWQGVLATDRQIGITDSFFELGGHSLKVIKLAAYIRKKYQVDLQVGEIFDHPTIKELAELIAGAEKNIYLFIQPTEKKEFYPLSSPQRRMYILQQMEVWGTAYNMPVIFQLDGQLDLEQLENTFRRLLKRQASLRTSFSMVNGEPVQVVHDNVEFSVAYHEAREEEAPELVKAFVRPFDLSIPPLLRVGVIKLARERHLLMVDLHHIIADGTSMMILIRDFAALYAGPEPGELQIQYTDYAEWLTRPEVQAQLQQQEQFWLAQFAGELPVLNLLSDYPRPAVQSFTGQVVQFTLEAEILAGLKRLALEEDATLYMVLLALFNIFLMKVTGQEDITVGTPIAGRNHADLEQVIGMFINMLAMRNYPRRGISFREFLRDVRERSLQVFGNADYQYEDLVEKVEVKRDMSRNPLFDVLFAFQNFDAAEPGIPGLTLKPYHNAVTTSRSDMGFFASERAGELVVNVEYCTDLFKESTIERFIGYFQNLVRSAVAEPERTLAAMEMMTAEEQKLLRDEFNQTEVELPAEVTISQLLLQAEALNPAELALIWRNGTQDGQLTYGEMAGRTNQLARLLQECGIGRGEYVGIYCERSANMLIGMLGVIKAGAAYIPLDIEHPYERIKPILQESGIHTLLTTRGAFGNPTAMYARLAAHSKIRRIIYLDQLAAGELVKLNTVFDTGLLAEALEKGIPVAEEAGTGLVLPHYRYGQQAMDNATMATKLEQLSQFIGQQVSGRDEVIGVLITNPLYRIMVQLCSQRHGWQLRLFDAETPLEQLLVKLKTVSETDRLGVVISELAYLDTLDRAMWESKYLRSVIILDEANSDRDTTEEEFRAIWDTVAEDSFAEINDYGWVSSYTHEKFSVQEMEEYVENVLVKLDALVNKETRMLEIGCGNGIIMYPLASKVQYYLGTDLSQVAVEKNREIIAERQIANLRVENMAASELDKLGAGEFDLILASSVIQYFPNSRYLEDVVGQSLRLLKGRGTIFFSDVLDAEKKAELIQSVEEYKASHPDARVRASWDDELYLPLEFFTGLQARFPEIVKVERSAKLGTIENELTRYRYDVLLTVEKDAAKQNSDSAEPGNSMEKRVITGEEIFGDPTLPCAKMQGEEPTAITQTPTITQTMAITQTLANQGGLSREGKWWHPGQILDATALAAYSCEPVEPGNTPEDLCYIIYTSGTTGKPKGVMIEHGNVANFITGVTRGVNFTGRTILALTTISFDISVLETVIPLTLGWRVVMALEGETEDPRAYAELIKRYGVDILQLTPSRLKLLLSVPEGVESLRQIKELLVGGEAFPEKLLKELQTVYSGKIYNMYGPTETTIWSAIKDLTAAEQVVIGSPLANTQLYILGEDRQMQPIGVAGELYISGQGLARGYFQQDGLTRERFVANPLGAGLLYRTGDLARWLPAGEVEFLGRVDHQVKIRGYRMELQDIESHLLAHPEITEAVVIAVTDADDEPALIGYFVAARELKVAELRRYLAGRLPEYMIPGYMIQVPKIPLTSNGKVDRKALPGIGQMRTGVAYEPPANEVESELVEMWRQILKVDQIGVRDNFFELGGNSLKIVMLISRIQQKFGVRVALTQIFEHASIRELAACIVERTIGEQDEPYVLLNREGQAPVFFFPPLIGYGLMYENLATYLPEYAIYAFNFIESADRLQQYVSAITALKPAGPYVLFGYSAGGYLAYQVAGDLERQGYSVSAVILFDPGELLVDNGAENTRINEEFIQQLADEMRTAGLEQFIDQLRSKVSGYNQYLGKFNSEFKIKAQLHLVTSLSNRTPEARMRWEQATTGELLTYEGSGYHQTMFTAELIADNAQLISGILQRTNETGG